MNIPCGIANFAVDPLYEKLILNGDDLANANFKPVQYGFAVACALGLIFIIYSLVKTLAIPDQRKEQPVELDSGRKDDYLITD